jgi:hypothetical protein
MDWKGSKRRVSGLPIIHASVTMNLSQLLVSMQVQIGREARTE